MMKLKKILTILLLTVIILAQFSFIQFENSVEATGILSKLQDEVNAKKFHYNQLDEMTKKIYDGLEEMNDNQILQTGTESYDLVKNGHFTSDEVKSYEDGDVNIKKLFYAARYAFYADHPEVFYVDYSKLSVRTTKGADGYHVYIGAGSNKNYRTEGFASQEEVEQAIVEFNSKVDEIVEEVENLQIEEGKNEVTEKIKYVHNKITKITGYRLETDCTPGNEDLISTPYGALVKGQAVCEGYARAFKYLMDASGIPCVLVSGTAINSQGQEESHAWNYVQINENWYAVDVTWDDPIITGGGELTQELKYKYFLKGSTEFKVDHKEDGRISENGKQFKFPTLSEQNYKP